MSPEELAISKSKPALRPSWLQGNFPAQLKALALADAEGEAQLSFGKLVQLRDDPLADKSVQLQAALAIVHQKWGRPKTAVELSGAVDLTKAVADLREGRGLPPA